jgi:hypothetical protein
MQFNNNQGNYLLDNAKETNIKLHDFIRQEEKEGGVIGKDFDYKQNDYFNINQPVYPSENENEVNKKNLTKSMNTNNQIINDIIKTKTYTSHNDVNKYKNQNNNIDVNNRYIPERQINITNKFKNKIEISPKNQGNKISLFQSQNNNEQKFNSFVIKKVNVNLNKNNNLINSRSPKDNTRQKKRENNNHMIKNETVDKMKYINLSKRNKPILQENSYQHQDNINRRIIYEGANLNLRTSRINTSNNKIINNSVNPNIIYKNTINNNNKIKPKVQILKINNDINNDIKNNKLRGSDIHIRTNNNLNSINIQNKAHKIIKIQKRDNYIRTDNNNINRNTPINHALNGNKNNQNRLWTDYDNIGFHEINNNNNSYNKDNKQYNQIKSYKHINNNFISYRTNAQPDKNIIINNLIIKKNFINLFFKIN